MHFAQGIDIDLSELDPVEPSLVEALSDRVLRHGDVDLWKRLFVGTSHSAVRYGVEELTLLAADSALVAPSPDDLDKLLELLGGERQPSRRVDLLLSFKDAHAAVRAAIKLQRLSEGHMLRANVRTCLFSVASFELRGAECRRVLGPELDATEESLSQSPRGVVTLSARTYELVGERLSAQLRNAVVTTELQDETVTCAYVALTPRASSPMSTFAGLGLSH